MTELTNQITFGHERHGVMPQKIERLLQNRFERKMAALDPKNKSLEGVRLAVKHTEEYAKLRSLISQPPRDMRPKKQPVTNQESLL